MELKEKSRRGDFIVILVGIMLSYFIYLVVLRALPSESSDYNGHLYTYLALFKKGSWIEGWMMVPYCMWHLSVLLLNRLLHIPLEVSAAYVTSFFHLFAYFVTYWMIRRYTEAKGFVISSGKASLIAFGLSVAQSLYFYWLDAGERFLGTFSMNPLHNPSHMTVRPFILLSFCLVCDIWGRQKDSSYKGIFFRVEQGLKKYYIYLAVVLFLSAAAKPVFAEMFIPSVGLLMLAEWILRIRRKDGSSAPYFRECLRMLLCAAPTLAYILLQFLAYFIWGGSYGADGSLVFTEWMEVWHMFSDNVILSIALGMAFPLFLALINGRFFLKDDMGKLALLGYLIGVLEAAILGEGGSKLSHGDFLWPMMCGMQLMWIAALLRLLVLEHAQTDTRAKRILVDLAWGLFCIHIVCGLVMLQDSISL